MLFWQDPQFGNKLITLMAALVLVLQIVMVAQRWLVTNIRAFGVQSFLLASIAVTIAYFNHAPQIYIVAVLTLTLKAIFVPLVLDRLRKRVVTQSETLPFREVPCSRGSSAFSGCLLPCVGQFVGCAARAALPA